MFMLFLFVCFIIPNCILCFWESVYIKDCVNTFFLQHWGSTFAIMELSPAYFGTVGMSSAVSLLVPNSLAIRLLGESVLEEAMLSGEP